MWSAVALGTALFLIGFIVWVAYASGVDHEKERRDEVLRRLTVPIRPASLPFEVPGRPAVPADLGRGDAVAKRRHCRAAHDGDPRPGSLSDRLRRAAAAEVPR